MSRFKAALAAGVQLLRDSLLVNAGYVFGVSSIGALSGFLLWLLAARFYPTDEVGLASAILSVAIWLAGLGSLGLGVGLMRFLPGAQAQERMLNTTITFVILNSFVVASVYLAGARLWSPTLVFLRQRPGLFAGFIIFVAALGIHSLLQTACQAFRASKYAFWQALVMNILRLSLVVPLASLGALGILGAVAIGVILAVTLSFAAFLPRVLHGYRLRLRWSQAAIRELTPYSVGNYVADISFQAPLLLTPLLALELLGPQSSAYAYVGWMIGYMFASPGIALAISAFAEGANTPDAMRVHLSRAARYGVTITLLISCFAMLAAPLVLKLFGDDYVAEATSLLRWLAVAAPLMVWNNVYFSKLRLEKRVAKLIFLSIICAALSLGIPLLTIQRLGLASTGIGWLAAQAFIALNTLRGS